MADEGARRIPCVGAVVVHDGRLLVVLRGHAPAQGLWSVPGGRVEDGESLAEACRREVREETGLEVVVGEVVGRVERDAPGGGVYVIDDLGCSVRGEPAVVAGDDADEARWVTRAELASLPLVPLLLETLDAWGVLDTMR